MNDEVRHLGIDMDTVSRIMQTQTNAQWVSLRFLKFALSGDLQLEQLSVDEHLHQLDEALLDRMFGGMAEFSNVMKAICIETLNDIVCMKTSSFLWAVNKGSVGISEFESVQLITDIAQVLFKLLGEKNADLGGEIVNEIEDRPLEVVEKLRVKYEQTAGMLDEVKEELNQWLKKKLMVRKLQNAPRFQWRTDIEAPPRLKRRKIAENMNDDAMSVGSTNTHSSLGSTRGGMSALSLGAHSQQDATPLMLRSHRGDRNHNHPHLPSRSSRKRKTKIGTKKRAKKPKIGARRRPRSSPNDGPVINLDVSPMQKLENILKDIEVPTKSGESIDWKNLGDWDEHDERKENSGFSGMNEERKMEDVLPIDEMEDDEREQWGIKADNNDEPIMSSRYIAENCSLEDAQWLLDKIKEITSKKLNRQLTKDQVSAVWDTVVGWFNFDIIEHGLRGRAKLQESGFKIHLLGETFVTDEYHMFTAWIRCNMRKSKITPEMGPHETGEALHRTCCSEKTRSCVLDSILMSAWLRGTAGLLAQFPFGWKSRSIKYPGCPYCWQNMAEHFFCAVCAVQGLKPLHLYIGSNKMRILKHDYMHHRASWYVL